ncbi:unnamed protein product [Aspergillus oryzae]|nr:unnamed protein product [Aspergillus oryzae]GMF90604.1 unnamed protein product [Aspergillus oryzae]
MSSNRRLSILVLQLPRVLEPLLQLSTKLNDVRAIGPPVAYRLWSNACRRGTHQSGLVDVGSVSRTGGAFTASLGTLELLEGKNLVDPVDRVHGQYVLPLALAQYIGYLGPPPLEIIQKSPLFQTYFDSKGTSLNLSLFHLSRSPHLMAY